MSKLKRTVGPAMFLVVFADAGVWAAKKHAATISAPRDLGPLRRGDQISALAKLSDKAVADLAAQARKLVFAEFDEFAVTAPIAIELFARTPEGKKSPGKRVVKHLRRLWRADRLRFVMGPQINYWGLAFPDREDAKKSDVKIAVNFALAAAPASMAAILAHEGLHAVQRNEGRGHDPQLTREIEGHQLQARVWKRLGRPASIESTGAAKDLEDGVDAFEQKGADTVALMLAIRYTNDHFSRFGTRMVRELLGDAFAKARRTRITCGSDVRRMSVLGVFLARDPAFDANKPKWKAPLAVIAASRNDAEFQTVFTAIVGTLDRAGKSEQAGLVARMFATNASNRTCPYRR
jgi:hypothetical protein